MSSRGLSWWPPNPAIIDLPGAPASSTGGFSGRSLCWRGNPEE